MRVNKARHLKVFLKFFHWFWPTFVQADGLGRVLVHEVPDESHFGGHRKCQPGHSVEVHLGLQDQHDPQAGTS